MLGKILEKRYSHIREGYTPQPEAWHAVDDCLPSTGLRCPSLPVLVLGGPGEVGGVFDMFTARYYPGKQDKPNRWLLCGVGLFPEDYRVDNVTHWRWLPKSFMASTASRYSSNLGL
jgi:hypothetical protein